MLWEGELDCVEDYEEEEGCEDDAARPSPAFLDGGEHGQWSMTFQPVSQLSC